MQNRFKKGHIVSLETKLKQSNSQKGNKNRLGIGHTEETKKRISKKLKEYFLNKTGGKKSSFIGDRKERGYRTWRKTCLERDDFSCKRCNKLGGELDIHHINNYSEFPELILEIENGITLCKDCHKKFHIKYGFKNNTLNQLMEFFDIYGSEI